MCSKDNPTTCGIGKCANSFPHSFWKATRSLFNLEVIPFYIIKPLEKLFLIHILYYYNAKLRIFREI